MRKKVEKNTAAKKSVEKKTVSAVKAAEPEAKVEEKSEMDTAEAASEEKPEVKAADPETKAEEKPEVEEEEKSAAKAAAKKAVKTTAEKKTTKKETAEKPAKTTKAASSQKIILQIGGREDLSMENLVERVKKAYADEGHSAASIKSIEVYIKPEEGMAYYVIDGYASGISL